LSSIQCLIIVVVYIGLHVAGLVFILQGSMFDLSSLSQSDACLWWPAPNL
jgi:hypothetical protein